jgi:hypothetical protein
MILTVIESPYAGDVERNLNYVRACMRDSLMRGEAPFPSHALYTQPGVLDDTIPEERKLGMEAGFAWGKWASRVAFYIDLSTSGWSSGMKEGLRRAEARGCELRTRTLGAPWSDLCPSDIGVAVNHRAVRRDAQPMTGIKECPDCKQVLGHTRNCARCVLITDVPSVEPLSVKKTS